MVMDPNERVLLAGEGERQGDYIFTANKVRLYLHSTTSSLAYVVYCASSLREASATFSNVSGRLHGAS